MSINDSRKAWKLNIVPNQINKETFMINYLRSPQANSSPSFLTFRSQRSSLLRIIFLSSPYLTMNNFPPSAGLARFTAVCNACVCSLFKHPSKNKSSVTLPWHHHWNDYAIDLTEHANEKYKVDWPRKIICGLFCSKKCSKDCSICIL